MDKAVENNGTVFFPRISLAFRRLDSIISGKTFLLMWIGSSASDWFQGRFSILGKIPFLNAFFGLSVVIVLLPCSMILSVFDKILKFIAGLSHHTKKPEWFVQNKNVAKLLFVGFVLVLVVAVVFAI